MNALRNRVQLIGRLGQNPEVKTLESGKMLATFSIATSDYHKNEKGERIEETQWHNIIAWGPKAEFVSKYLQKGKEVALEGKLMHRSYENSNGDKRYITEINLNEIVLIGGTKAKAED